MLPRDDLFAKNVSTLEEIRARSGPDLTPSPIRGGPPPVAVNGVIEVPEVRARAGSRSC